MTNKQAVPSHCFVRAGVMNTNACAWMIQNKSGGDGIAPAKQALWAAKRAIIFHRQALRVRTLNTELSYLEQYVEAVVALGKKATLYQRMLQMPNSSSPAIKQALLPSGGTAQVRWDFDATAGFRALQIDYQDFTRLEELIDYMLVALHFATENGKTQSLEGVLTQFQAVIASECAAYSEFETWQGAFDRFCMNWLVAFHRMETI